MCIQLFVTAVHAHGMTHRQNWENNYCCFPPTVHLKSSQLASSSPCAKLWTKTRIPVCNCHDWKVLDAHSSNVEWQDVTIARTKRLLQFLGSPLWHSNYTLTNDGVQFASMLIATLYTMLRVKHLTTTPYHLQINGQIERYNCTIFTGLRHYVAEIQKFMDIIVPQFR